MRTERTQLLTIPDAARRLSVSPRTVKNWIRAGSLPAVLLGDGQRDRRVSVADLEAWIEERRSR